MRPRLRSLVGLGLAVATLTAVVAERGRRSWLPRSGSVEVTTGGALSVPDVPIGNGGGPDASAADASRELAAQLAAGRAVIAGLVFARASDTLGPASDEALARLAAALTSTPGVFMSSRK